MAAGKGTPAIVQELINAKANVSEEDEVRKFSSFFSFYSLATKNGATPLHCALNNNRVRAAEILIKAGANVFCNSKVLTSFYFFLCAYSML